MPKRPTMHEVARVSGVSTSTVSRAIAGSSLVAEDVKDRILKAARKVGYRPSVRRTPALMSARAVKPPHLEVLLFSKAKIEEFTTGTFAAQVLHGIQAEALRLQNAKVSMQSYDQPRLDSELLETLSQRDGIILMGSVDRHLDCLEQILDMEIPLVVAGQQVSGKKLNSVTTENYAPCQDLTDYLFEMGFRRFGWLGVRGGAPLFDDRLEMVRGRLMTKGIHLAPKDCRFTDDDSETKNVLELIDRWIEEGDLPEVVICARGPDVVFLQRSLASHGLRCPDDLSITCFNNYHYPEIYHPVPTRMAGFPEEIGRRAYRRLLEIIREEQKGAKPEFILIPMQFIEGDSIKPPER